MFLFFLFLPRSLRTQDSLIRALKIIRLLEEVGGGPSVTAGAGETGSCAVVARLNE